MVKYYYEAYGSLIEMVDTSNINLGLINPFRFKSYYQDGNNAIYASCFENSNYGGYDLLNNNCLHYVHNCLIYSWERQGVYNGCELETFIPSLYKPKKYITLPYEFVPIIYSYNFKGGGSNIYYFEPVFKILERYLVR